MVALYLNKYFIDPLFQFFHGERSEGDEIVAVRFLLIVITIIQEHLKNTKIITNFQMEKIKACLSSFDIGVNNVKNDFGTLTRAQSSGTFFSSNF